jgi:hypothetical protein
MGQKHPWESYGRSANQKNYSSFKEHEGSLLSSQQSASGYIIS